MKINFLLIIGIFFFFFHCKKEEKDQQFKKELMVAFPFVKGEKFGAVNIKGDTLIKPVFDYIQPLFSSFSRHRIFLDSSYVEINVSDLHYFDIETFYESSPCLILNVKENVLDVVYRKSCSYPRMADISKKIIITDDSLYVLYQSKTSCDGFILSVVGDMYYYSEENGRIVFKGQIDGGILYLSHAFEDDERHINLLESIPSFEADSLYCGAYDFYRLCMPSLFLDISCEDSSYFNFILCPEVYSL